MAGEQYYPRRLCRRCPELAHFALEVWLGAMMTGAVSPQDAQYVHATKGWRYMSRDISMLSFSTQISRL